MFSYDFCSSIHSSAIRTAYISKSNLSFSSTRMYTFVFTDAMNVFTNSTACYSKIKKTTTLGNVTKIAEVKKGRQRHQIFTLEVDINLVGLLMDLCLLKAAEGTRNTPMGSRDKGGRKERRNREKTETKFEDTRYTNKQTRIRSTDEVGMGTRK